MACPQWFRIASIVSILLVSFLITTHATAAGQRPRLWEERGAPGSDVVHEGLSIFMSLAEQLSPAVVNISIVQKTKQQSERPFRGFRRPFRERQPFGQDPFREFFDRYFSDAPPQARQSLGSGFIMHAKGLILTNNHVIEEAEKIKVTLQDEREFEATVIGRDPKTDLALIKVESSVDLPTVPLGNSDALRIGEWVLAIGNPFGLSHTVTAGIVSAKGRVIGAGQYDDFIQTDASINPGNSGGPLFNTRGEVVGINTAIIAGGTGIGFATPINLVKELVPQLHDQGKVTRGWLGVMIQKVTPELARTFDLPQARGALVADVISESPAAQGGLQQGDIITGFDGSDIQDMHELPRVVAKTEVGKLVEVRILRQGKAKTLSVTIAPLREETAVAEAEPTVMDRLGMEVEDLTPASVQRMGLSNAKGVLVAKVDPEGPAAEAGIRSGDVILEVNRHGIADTRSYIEALQNHVDDTILLLVARDENTLYVALQYQK
ncbi:DegQ family serine endoprotease [Candidatus Entotheonella palauensis]|uniref:DegQ family serine endoprotease n=1 Tax=Candidatus Entotheonella palauensis TaxID=93172 RepID=UPI000B7C7963|nr:DegQ family serine endoprotease [Candidatus Entotheonella palauensis]